MDVNRILSELDSEIARLQQIRTALSGVTSKDIAEAPRRGRPKGSKNTASSSSTTKPKRQLSPEGRKRIAEAMKKRWAERRKVVSK